MSELTEDLLLTQTEMLLTNYRFELKQNTPKAVVARWRQKYSTPILRLAVLEALYQGRYKSESVEQILNLWVRRQNITFHFSREFEKLICDNLHIEQPLEAEPQKTREIINYIPTENLSPFYIKLKKVAEQDLAGSQNQDPSCYNL